MIHLTSANMPRMIRLLAFNLCIWRRRRI